MEVGSAAELAAFFGWRKDFMSLEMLKDECRYEGELGGEARGEARGRLEGLKQGKLNILDQLLSAGIITPEQAKQFANA